MTVESYSNLLALSGTQQSAGLPAKWTFLVSLVLHLCVLTLIFGLRSTPRVDRPLAAYHVSLVSLPSTRQAAAPTPPRPVETEPVAPALESPSPAASASQEVEPVASPPVPARLRPTASPRQQAMQAPERMPKPTAPKVAPVPAFPTPQEAREVGRQPENPLRDALRGIELPPEAPKLGKVKPMPATVGKAAPPPSQKEIENLLSSLKVPDATLSPKPVPRRPSEPQPAVQAKATGAQKPETDIKVPGVAPNRYLALVQNRISSQWSAPPVELPGTSLRVVIRFRLDRSGSVSDVVVETKSGNEYFDDAGRRAVLKAGRLPPFPPDMTDPYLDTHFSFTVGEEAG
jgi:TonB family protein